MEPIEDFEEWYNYDGEIARGGEGIVSRWRHVETGETIAVKEIARSDEKLRTNLLQEARNVNTVGGHENIVNMLGFDEDWSPDGPAIMYELASLGDAYAYKRMLSTNHGIHALPELTLLKLMSDMSSGINHLHNNLSRPHIHMDIKPQNILVYRDEVSWANGELPLAPTFKLCDFSHIYAWEPGKRPDRYFGTPEYMPPENERGDDYSPAVDVYSLGASVQDLALGVRPVMTPEQFIQTQLAAGRLVPTAEQIRTERPYWRWEIPGVARPINDSFEDQRKNGVVNPTGRYSDVANNWYQQMMNGSHKVRISAKNLAKYFVPVAEEQMIVESAKMINEKAMEDYEELKKKRLERRQKREARKKELEAERLVEEIGEDEAEVLEQQEEQAGKKRPDSGGRRPRRANLRSAPEEPRRVDQERSRSRPARQQKNRKGKSLE